MPETLTERRHIMHSLDDALSTYILAAGSRGSLDTAGSAALRAVADAREARSPGFKQVRVINLRIDDEDCISLALAPRIASDDNWGLLITAWTIDGIQISLTEALTDISCSISYTEAAARRTNRLVMTLLVGVFVGIMLFFGILPASVLWAPPNSVFNLRSLQTPGEILLWVLADTAVIFGSGWLIGRAVSWVTASRQWKMSKVGRATMSYRQAMVAPHH